MRLHPTDTNYNDDRYNFLRSELIEGYRQFAYVDTRGVATIGIGFNIRLLGGHQDLILQTFGFDIAQTLTGQAGIDEQKYIEDIRLALNRAYAPNDTTSLQAALNTIMDARYANIIYPPDFVRRQSFRFEGGALPAGETEARGVFEQLMVGYTAGGTTDPGYETKLNNWLTVNNIAAIGDSKERIALLSLAYQGWINGTGTSPKLAAALKADDRAEAYYEIAYNTNTESRRYREANLFGIYNTNPAEADYKSAYRMFTRHKEAILGADLALGGTDGYEDKNPPPEAGMSIFWQLKAARDYLLPLYDQGVSIAWSRILVGEDATTNYYRGTDNDVLTASDSQGARSDLILGDSGNDVIQGGLGSDVLYGGQGVDIYRYRPNDGSDVIVDYAGGPNATDGDGKGAILYDPEGNVQPLAFGLRKSTDPLGQYKSPDGTITYNWSGTPGADLVIQTPTGTITVKNYSQNNLGIQLRDLPPDTTSTVLSNTPTPAGTDDYIGWGDAGSDTFSVLVDSGTGNDYVYTLGGADRLILGPATADRDNDFGRSGAGNDIVAGGAGSDLIYGGAGDDILYAGTEADLATIFTPGIVPTLERDWIAGGSGSDLLVGSAGENALFGGAGEDILYGGAGNDSLMGDTNLGLDFDTYMADFMNVGWTYTEPSPNFREFQLDGRPAFALGVDTTPGGADTIYGGDGNDWIIGEAGNDLLFGDNDDDYLDGDAYNIDPAQYGNDTLVGGTGKDTLVGNGGDDVLLGGAGNDTLTGDAGNLAVAYQGNDYLDGGAGDDYLFGLGGNDVLAGGRDRDALFGGADNDTYVFNRGDGQDSITEESGTDTLTLGSGILPQDIALRATGTNLVVSLTGASDTVTVNNWYGAAATRVEYLQFADGTVWDQTEIMRRTGTYVANGSAALVDESSENTTYIAALGPDTPDTGPIDFNIAVQDSGGNDTLKFEKINIGPNPFGGYNFLTPVLTGVSRQGDDLLLDVWLSFGALQNQPDLRGQVRIVGQYTTGEIERVLVGGTVLATGGGGALNPGVYYDTGYAELPWSDSSAYGVNNNFRKVLVSGGAGNDTLTPVWNVDTFFYGNGGDDLLIGHNGRDTFRGGPGNDRLEGKQDYDTYYIDPAQADTIFDDGRGEGYVSLDTLALETPVALSELTFARDGYDLLIGATRIERYFERDLTQTDAGRQKPYVIEILQGNGWSEGNLPAYLSGLGLRFPVTGTNANDSLQGNADNEHLMGLGGDDMLWGKVGNDTLDGGAGIDSLVGGDDGDTYLIYRGGAFDYIEDVNTLASVLPDQTDVVEFGPGITPENIRVEWNEGVWYEAFPGEGTTLSPGFLAVDIGNREGFQTYDADGGRNFGLELFRFVDGRTLSLDQLLALDQSPARIGPQTGTAGNDVLLGSFGQDQLYGYAGADVLIGDDRNDELYGGSGDDILVGGGAEDNLFGDDGSDVYLINPGDGSAIYADYISDWSSIPNPDDIDTLSFGGGIRPENLDAYLQVLQNPDGSGSSALYLRLRTTGEQVWIDWSATYDNGSGLVTDDMKIERLQFLGSGDDRVYDLAGLVNARYAELRAAYDANPSNPTPVALFTPATLWAYDITAQVPVAGGGQAQEYATTGQVPLTPLSNSDITGTSNADTLTGTSGDDVIYGLGGNDTLNGLAGNDTLNGGAGNDTYIFNRASGQDSITDNDTTAGNQDKAQIGVNPLDLVLTRSGNNLLMSLHGGTDTLTVNAWYTNTSYQVETLQAQNGSTLLNNQVDLLIQAMAQFSASNGGITWDQAIDQRPSEVSAIIAAYWQPGA